MKYNVYHSPWPIILAFNLGFTLINLLNSGIKFFLSLLLILIIIFVWSLDFYLENKSGKYGNLIKLSLKWAFSMFLLTETMYFAALFWCLISNMFNPSLTYWPPVDFGSESILIPSLGTVLLIGSSISATAGHHYYNLGKILISNFFLLVTILMGVAFLSFTGLEFYVNNFTISDGIYGSIVYMLLGTHLIHVILGLICLIVSPSGLCREYAIYYWHYVDTVWLFVYSLIYIFSSSYDVTEMENVALVLFIPPQSQDTSEIEGKKDNKFYFLKENRKCNPFEELLSMKIFEEVKNSQDQVLMYLIISLLTLQIVSLHSEDVKNKIFEILTFISEEDSKISEWKRKVRDFSTEIVNYPYLTETRPVSNTYLLIKLNEILTFPYTHIQSFHIWDKSTLLTILSFLRLKEPLLRTIKEAIVDYSNIVSMAESKNLFKMLKLSPEIHNQNPLNLNKDLISFSLEETVGSSLSDYLKVMDPLNKPIETCTLPMCWKGEFLEIYDEGLKLFESFHHNMVCHLIMLGLGFVYAVEEKVSPSEREYLLTTTISSARHVRNILFSHTYKFGVDLILESSNLKILQKPSLRFKPIPLGSGWKYCMLILRGNKRGEIIPIIMKREMEHLFQSLSPRILVRYPRSTLSLLPGQPGFEDEEWPEMRESILSK